MKKLVFNTISLLMCVMMLNTSLMTFAAAEIKDISEPVDVPRITFTTENGKGTSLQKADGYINATLDIKDTDGYTLSDDVTIKVRGNSTAFTSIGKKSYNFKFAKKKNLFEMGSGKKWALISNIYDPTLARNYIAFSLAQELGIQYSSNFKVVEVVVDGSFRGCYLLMEPVGEGKDRVDIDIESDDGKKDFLLELEALREEDDVTYFKTNGIRFAVSEPDPPSDEQVSYIQSTMDDVISTVRNGAKEEIENSIDLESFVKFYLLNEFLKTVDFDFSSLFYYYKDGKLYAGPPWDYDLSSGNVNENFSARYASSYKTDGLFISNYNLYKWLCSKEWFNELCKEEFEKHYQYFESIASDGGVIDSFYNTYKLAINRNFTDAGWQVNRYYVNAMKTPLTTYKENYDFYVNWCKERVEWLRDYYGIVPVVTEPVTDTPTEPDTNEPTTDKPTEHVTSEPIKPTTEKPTELVTTEPTEPTTDKPTEPATTEPTEPTTDKPTELVTTEPTEPTMEKPTEPVTSEPIEPITEKPAEPVVTEPITEKPVEPIVTEPKEAPQITQPTVKPKKANPMKLSVKTKTVSLKKLKAKKQSVKPFVVKNAKGKVMYKIKSVSAKIKKYTKISSKGVVTIKRWKKAKVGTYKFKVRISVKGNSKYKPKTLTKTIKIRIK